jgi:3',5'-cyclic-AMP phosphodiesterase
MIFRRRSLAIFLLLLLASCEFKLSPYVAKIPKQQKNSVTLQRIKTAEPSAPSDFKVAFLSDTHNYYERLGDAVKKINENGPYAFVIITGDITNFGLVDEYEMSIKEFNGLSFPYFVVVGNHDLLSNGKSIYERLFGETNFSFTYQNVLFVILNNNNWESSGRVPDLEWLRSQFISDSSPRRIIAAHVSPGDEERFSSQEIRNWEQIIQDYSVDYVMHGHNHNPGEEVRAGGTQITIGAPSKGSFYELIFSGGGVTHKKMSF